MAKFSSTKIIELGSTAFRQPRAQSHCKHVHGYLLKAKVWIGCNELDANNWVFDFGGFKDLKNTLQKTYDHTLIIAKDDPAKTIFKELERYDAVNMVVMDGVGIEKFAEHVFHEVDTHVKFLTQNRAWCEKVEVFEHENNSAIYQKEQQQIIQQIPAIEAIKVEATKVEPYDLAASEPVPAPLHNPVTSMTPSQANPNGPQPAGVGNKITTGWSNPFAGTSWGT